MLLERIAVNNDNNEIESVESIFDSSNIMKALYVPKQKRLFIYFQSGGVYCYYNFDYELYTEFEKAESQGDFFNKHIRHNEDIVYNKHFNLMEHEIKDIKDKIKEVKNGDTGQTIE